MRVHTFDFTGTGIQKWTVDQDTTLTAVVSDIQWVLSENPSWTIFTWNNSPALDQQRDQFAISNETVVQLMNLAFELSAKQEIYCAVSAVGKVQLYLID